VWSAKKYSSILCSILLTKTRVKGEMVAISSALAVMDALPLGVHNQAQIKWPNDVLVNGRKIAGILVESSRQEFGVCHIVGIGINCDQKADDIGAELRDIATSITIENFACSSRNLIAGRLLSAFEHRLKQAENDPGTIVELSKKLSSLINTRVSLKFNNRSFTGRCVDIDPLGGIVLQLDGGGVRMFDAAHTTLGSLKG
jgi:BirA family biotin operon repressor/biotin-[acetyl-CoA-carboxylase] ligase